MFVCLCILLTKSLVHLTPLKTIVISTKDGCPTLLANDGYFGQACTLFYFYSCLFCKFKLIKGANKVVVVVVVVVVGLISVLLSLSHISQVFQSAPTNNFLSQVNITVKYSSKTKIRDPVSATMDLQQRDSLCCTYLCITQQPQN